MVDLKGPKPLLKLVDFGESVRINVTEILPPSCLEFAAPEMVLGQPLNGSTDLWSVGVFLYVLVSGVSPFLDDSIEETTSNILKCDYCFPHEYFETISSDVKLLISQLLVLSPNNRISMKLSLDSSWFQNVINFFYFYFFVFLHKKLSIL